jgi:hypothetical protein
MKVRKTNEHGASTIGIADFAGWSFDNDSIGAKVIHRIGRNAAETVIAQIAEDAEGDVLVSKGRCHMAVWFFDSEMRVEFPLIPIIEEFIAANTSSGSGGLIVDDDDGKKRAEVVLRDMETACAILRAALGLEVAPTR